MLNNQTKHFVEEGYLDPPKGEIPKKWKKIKRLIFKSTIFGDDTDRAYKRMMIVDLFAMMLHIIQIRLIENTII